MMERFTVRVELHRGTSEDYELLHVFMGIEGFTRTIIADGTGEEFYLPTAEYNLIGHYSKAQVLAKAESAATLVGKSYSILVTPSTGRTWANLERVSNASVR